MKEQSDAAMEEARQRGAAAQEEVKVLIAKEVAAMRELASQREEEAVERVLQKLA